jgi:hypothetical protein
VTGFARTLLALLALAATPAAAEDTMALVYARGSGRVAIAIARPDSAAAIAAARAECGADCAVMAVVAAGSCLALAREAGQSFGWSTGDSEASARASATGFCRGADAARTCPAIAARCLPNPRAPSHYGSATPVAIADPANTIVIIHSHGSRPAREVDPCEMDRVNAGYGVPNVIHALDGATIAGRRVVVDGFCTPTRGGVIDSRTGQAVGKITPRAREIGERAAAYVAMGVPPRQIILSGHSAGGWASLLVERQRPEVIGAVIAFAPAAFGRAVVRDAPLQATRRARYAELTAAVQLRALIFGFVEDSYETADDLRALAAVRGVEFVAIPQPGPDGRRCALAPHTRVRDPCFAETQGQRIRAFIATRVANGEPAQ